MLVIVPQMRPKKQHRMILGAGQGHFPHPSVNQIPVTQLEFDAVRLGGTNLDDRRAPCLPDVEGSRLASLQGVKSPAAVFHPQKHPVGR